MVCIKKTYDHYHHAERVLRNMRKRDGYRGEIYICPNCGLLHIGQNRKVKRQQRRRP